MVNFLNFCLNSKFYISKERNLVYSDWETKQYIQVQSQIARIYSFSWKFVVFSWLGFTLPGWQRLRGLCCCRMYVRLCALGRFVTEDHRLMWQKLVYCFRLRRHRRIYTKVTSSFMRVSDGLSKPTRRAESLSGTSITAPIFTSRYTVFLCLAVQIER